MTRHVHCEADLREQLHEAAKEAADNLGVPGVNDGGVDVHITTVPPLVPSRWTAAFECAHGTTFYMEPTGEQIAKWERVMRP